MILFVAVDDLHFKNLEHQVDDFIALCTIHFLGRLKLDHNNHNNTTDMFLKDILLELI